MTRQEIDREWAAIKEAQRIHREEHGGTPDMSERPDLILRAFRVVTAAMQEGDRRALIESVTVQLEAAASEFRQAYTTSGVARECEEDPRHDLESGEPWRPKGCPTAAEADKALAEAAAKLLGIMAAAGKAVVEATEDIPAEPNSPLALAKAMIRIRGRSR